MRYYSDELFVSSKRGVLAQEIAADLKGEFEARHLHIVSFAIREVHLPDVLKAQLDQKIQAQQQAEQQKYQLEQARIKADQDKVVAEGQANAEIAKARGEAQARTIRAEAEAQANERLARSITPGLIQYQLAQRWDGRQPQVMGGGSPLIDLRSTGVITETK